MSTGIVVIVCLGMVLAFLLIAIRLSGDKKPPYTEPKPPQFWTWTPDGETRMVGLGEIFSKASDLEGLDVCPLCGHPVKGNK